MISNRALRLDRLIVIATGMAQSDPDHSETGAPT